MKVSFFGHSDYEPDENDIDAIISKLKDIVGDNSCEFLLGGIGAFDMFAKRCCLIYKEINPNVKLTLVLPYLIRNYKTEGYDESVYPPLETAVENEAFLFKKLQKMGFFRQKPPFLKTVVLCCARLLHFCCIFLAEMRAKIFIQISIFFKKIDV